MGSCLQSMAARSAEKQRPLRGLVSAGRSCGQATGKPAPPPAPVTGSRQQADGTATVRPAARWLQTPVPGPQPAPPGEETRRNSGMRLTSVSLGAASRLLRLNAAHCACLTRSSAKSGVNARGTSVGKGVCRRPKATCRAWRNASPAKAERRATIKKVVTTRPVFQAPKCRGFDRSGRDPGTLGPAPGPGGG